MNLDLIPSPIENAATAHPSLAHGLLVAGGVILAGAIIIGATRCS